MSCYSRKANQHASIHRFFKSVHLEVITAQDKAYKLANCEIVYDVILPSLIDFVVIIILKIPDNFNNRF